MDEQFAKVPSWIFDSKEFLPREKLVFTALCMFRNSKGYCAPSVQELADASSLSKAPVFEALNGLEDKGAITRDKRFQNGSQTTNLYTVNRVRNPDTAIPRPLKSRPPKPERRFYTDDEIAEFARKMIKDIDEEYEREEVIKSKG